jgi:hypothetical protein
MPQLERAARFWKQPLGLEKDEADQSNDRDPSDRVRHNEAVPEFATGRIMLRRYRAVCVSSDHRCLPGKRFRDKRLVSCGRFRPLKLRDHRRTHDTSTFANICTGADYETSFSFQRTMLLETTVHFQPSIRVRVMLRLFEFEIESNLVPEVRLCMAVSGCTQHNKRATLTKHLLIKAISCVAQILRRRAAKERSEFSVLPPYFVQTIGKV